ncbi:MULTISPECIES: GtrA family protein [unclassified Rubrivivax]|uniref:GtrA family protein n=1 Tax=unclassified Rubrivivax TaxID=2649762 RepID=UPI001E4013BF|nr:MULTISPECIES: GtrA family protein [unclassified Rubrivivax]MCC9596333.1 GtrA family protein [Rubrivivax sp. JA1055]MCC9647326.1 GtrA family protein [Rubrivivax sp. JA1029]
MLFQVLRFLIVGVLNTAVGLGTIYLLKWAGGFGDVAANACGYAVGLCVSFVLNRRWTFADRGRRAPAVMRFLLVFAIAYGFNLLTLLHLRDAWHIDAYLAHALATVPYTVTFFLGSKFFVFRSVAPAIPRA